MKKHNLSSAVSLMLTIAIIVQSSLVGVSAAYVSKQSQNEKTENNIISDVIHQDVSLSSSMDDFSIESTEKLKNRPMSSLNFQKIESEFEARLANKYMSTPESDHKKAFESVGSSANGYNNEINWTLNYDTGELTFSGSGWIFADDNINSISENVKSITIDQGITGINEYAFLRFPNLTSVTVASSVTQIGYGAFAQCPKLVNAEISGTIGHFAFYQCENLKSVNITSNCQLVCENAFTLDASLTSITIPTGCEIIGVRAFAGCSSLKNITLPDTLKHMGEYAFYACKSLSEIIIPEGLTTIKTGCFGGDAENGYCDSLASITLPSTLTNMDGFVFEECHALKTVTMPNYFISLNAIPLCTFIKCYALESIIIPEGIQEIADEAFAYCNNLKQISLPSSCTQIGEGAFYECSDIDNIVISDGVTVLNKGTFYNCKSLKNIQLPNSITKIDTHVFRGCTSLYGIVLPDQLKTILDFGFALCENLESITIPSSVTEIGKGVFCECHNLSNVFFSGNIINLGSHVFFDCMALESITLPDGLTSLGEYDFTHCTSLNSIKIPSGVTKISKGMFASCEKLQTVYLSENITEISSYAFSNCFNLSEINLPSTLKTIKEYAFISCETIRNIDLPEGLENIGDGAFADCICLESMQIPSSVNSIGACALVGLKNSNDLVVADGNAAFVSTDNIIYSRDMTTLISALENKNLQNYVIPQTVTSLAPGVFYGNKTLEKITIPETITQIPDRAFYGCSNLRKIKLHNKITSLGKYSISLCFSLENIQIPQSVTEIGVGAFFGDTSVLSIAVPDGIEIIPDFFVNNCTKLETVTLPNSVKEIGDYAFSWDEHLTKIVLPQNTKQIGEGVFSNCISLTSISLPKEIEYIEAFSFANCSELNSVVFNGAIYAIGNYAFRDNKNLVEVLFSGDAPTTIGTAAFANTNEKLQLYYNSGANGWTSPEWEGPDKLIYHTATSVSGSCGENVYWRLSTETGELTVNGEDKMFSWAESSDTPWHEYIDIIKSVVIAEGVTEVGARAFMNCSYLESAFIADSVKTFGYGVFAECENLQTVTSPMGLHMISQAMFFNCAHLTDLSFADDMTEIQDYGFYRCAAIEAIIVPTGVTQIKEGVFADCESLYTARFLGQINTIESGAFINCKSLSILCFFGSAPASSDRHPKALLGIPQSLIVYSKSNSNVWTDGAGTDYQNIDISTLSGSCGSSASWEMDVITGNLTISGTGALNNYTEASAPWYKYRELITTVSIAEGVTRIGNYNFAGLTSMLVLNLPQSVDRINKYAFASCINLFDLDLPSNLTTIGEGVFFDCSSLDEISINSNIQRIEPYTFSNCTQMHHVNLPSTVKEIGYSAFYYCVNLEEINLPPSVTVIDDWAFAHCITIESIDLSQSVVNVGEYAFNDCRSLKNILFGSNSIHFGKFAFSQTGIISINIPSTITEIKEGMFANCSNLSNVTLNNVNEIGEFAFYGCKRLATVSLSNVTTIRPKAFMASGLQSVNLPSTVSSVGIYAFADCDSLVEIKSDSPLFTTSKGVLYHGNMLLQYPSGKNEENFTISSKIESIAEGAFYGADNLNTVVISNTVTSIGKAAFACSSMLQSVSVGCSVTKLETAVFGECQKLKEVFFSGNAPKLATDVFYNTSDELVLYSYESGAGWTTPTWTGSDGITYNSQMIEKDSIFISFGETDEKNAVKISVFTTANCKEGYADLILAVYNQNGRYSDTRHSKVHLKNFGHTAEIQYTIFGNVVGAKVKAMLLSGETHYPVAECIETNIGTQKRNASIESNSNNKKQKATESVGIELPKDNSVSADSMVRKIDAEFECTGDYFKDTHRLLHDENAIKETDETHSNKKGELNTSFTIYQNEVIDGSIEDYPISYANDSITGSTKIAKVKVSTVVQGSFGGIDTENKGYSGPSLSVESTAQYSVVEHEAETKPWIIGGLIGVKVGEEAQVLNAEVGGTASLSGKGVELKASAGVDVAKAKLKFIITDAKGNAIITVKGGGTVGAGAGVSAAVESRKIGIGAKAALGLGGEVEVSIDPLQLCESIASYYVDYPWGLPQYIWTKASTVINNTIVKKVNDVYNEYIDSKTRTEIMLQEMEIQDTIMKELNKRNRVLVMTAAEPPAEAYISALPAIYPVESETPSLPPIPPDVPQPSYGGGNAGGEPPVPVQTPPQQQQAVSSQVTLTQEQQIEILRMLLLPSLLGYNSQIGLNNAIATFGAPATYQILNNHSLAGFQQSAYDDFIYANTSMDVSAVLHVNY